MGIVSSNNNNQNKAAPQAQLLNNAAVNSSREEAPNSSIFDNKADNEIAKNISNPAPKKPELKVNKDIFSLFLGGYGILTALGIFTDQMENIPAMLLRHLNNANATDDERIPENHPLKKYIADARKGGWTKDLLRPVGNVLGFEDTAYDGVGSFASLCLSKLLKVPYSMLGLNIPFNMPTDRDPGAKPDEKTEYNFAAYKDLSPELDENGQAKFDENGQPIFNDPRGAIRQWTNNVNPNPHINADPKRSLWKKLNYPTASRQSLSLAFLIRNGASIFFEKKQKNLGIVGNFFNVFKLAGSAVSAAVGPIAAFSSWLFAINGKKDLTTASNLLSLMGGIFIPANHGGEVITKIISAWNTSRKEGGSFKEHLKEKGVWNFGRMLHGIAGGLTMIPTNIGNIARMFQVYCWTRFFFVKAAKELAQIAHKNMLKFGITHNKDSSFIEDKFTSVVTGTAKFFRNIVVPTTDTIINLTPIKTMLKPFLATVKNPETGEERISLAVYDEILKDIEHSTDEEYVKANSGDKFKHFIGAPTVDKFAKDLSVETKKENLIFGWLPKYQSMMSLFKVFGAFTPWSVCMSYAFDPWLDKDIQKSKGPLAPLFKVFDYGIGTINKIFALPNVLVYGFTARFPQAFASICDLVQRYADAKAWTGKAGDKYNIMTEFVNPFIDKLLGSRFGILRLLGKNLNEDLRFNPDNKNNDLFIDQTKANNLVTKHFENLSFKQEYCVEAPVVVDALRNLMKLGLQRTGAIG